MLAALVAACPEVDAELTGNRWTPAAEASFRGELKVEASRERLCLVESTARDAHVRVVWQGEEPMGISVSWMNGQTERQLRRRLEPQRVAKEGLMLALAAVVGELLHEARVALVPEPVVEVAPPVPVAVVEAAPSRQSVGISVRLGGELYSAGAHFGGGELSVRPLLPSRFEIDLFVGGRTALVRSNVNGSVSMSALTFGLGVLFHLLELQTVLVSVQLSGMGAHQWVTATPVAAVTGRSTQAWTAVARAGLELAWRPGRTWWALGAGLGVPVRGLALTDGASTIAAVNGVEAYLTLAGGFGL